MALTANSYYIYLVHYPLLMVPRLLLLTWDGPVFVKFTVVLIVALLGSYALSQYLIRPFSRLSAIGLVALHVLLCTVGLPRSSYSHLLLDRREQLHAVVPAEISPERIDVPAPESEDSNPWNLPDARVSWQDGTFYFAYTPGGLHALLPDGSQAALAPDLELGDMTPLADGHLAVVETRTGNIVELDDQGQIVATLAASSASNGTPANLVADLRGGIYFTTIPEGESGKVFYRSPQDRLLPVAEVGSKNPSDLILGAGGSTLFLSDRDSGCVWSFAVEADGQLAERRRFAELFLGDGRYGHIKADPVDSRAEGMAIDTAGRLYVATYLGVQIFSPTGDLLGVVDFPEVLLSWNPKPPLSCVFGGDDLSTLYVSYGDEVYTIPTRATGIPPASAVVANFSLGTVKPHF